MKFVCGAREIQPNINEQRSENEDEMTAVVTGGTSGLGKCIVNELWKHGHKVIVWATETGVDVSNEASVADAATFLPEKIDILVNCAGINGINFIPQVTSDEWDAIMDVNAKGIFLCVKHLAERLRGGAVLNIVSNAAHIPMTNSVAYNASKAAARMITRQMDRELFKTHGITVFSVSPNKMSGTGMSDYIERRVQDLRGWTAEEAKKYQLAALPAGEETPPEVIAEFIGFLLEKKSRHKYLGGCDIPYGGPTI